MRIHDVYRRVPGPKNHLQQVTRPAAVAAGPPSHTGSIQLRIVLLLLCLLPPSLGLPSFGLPSTGLHHNNFAIGVLPDWSLLGPAGTNSRFGAATPLIGDYVQLSPTEYSAAQIGQHLPEVVRVAEGTGVKAVWAIAVLFEAGLESWTSAMTDSLVGQVVAVNARGVTVWLRLFHEMVSLL